MRLNPFAYVAFSHCAAPCHPAIAGPRTGVLASTAPGPAPFRGPPGLGKSCPPPSSTATACRSAAGSSRCARKRFQLVLRIASLRSTLLGLRRPAAGRTQTPAPNCPLRGQPGPPSRGLRRQTVAVEDGGGPASGCFIFLDRAPTCRSASPAFGLARTPRAIKKNAALRWPDLRTT